MKFLLIRKPRMGTGMTPTSETVRAHKDTVLGTLERGETDCVYAFVGGGGCAILNADSAEELNQRLMGAPLGLFYEYEIRALADYGQFMDTMAKALEKQNR